MFRRIILTSLAILIHVNSIANDADINKLCKKIEYARTHPPQIYSPKDFCLGAYLGLLTPGTGTYLGIYKLNKTWLKLELLQQKKKLNNVQLIEYDELKIDESGALGVITGSSLSLLVLGSILCSGASNDQNIELNRMQVQQNMATADFLKQTVDTTLQKIMHFGGNAPGDDLDLD